MSKGKWILASVGVVISLGVIGSIFGGEEGSNGEEITRPKTQVVQQTPTPRPTSASRAIPTATVLADTLECAITLRACEHFRNVLVDINAGILSTVEIRGKFQEIYSDTKGGIPSAEAAAQRALAAITQDDGAAWLIAITDLTNACLLCSR